MFVLGAEDHRVRQQARERPLTDTMIITAGAKKAVGRHGLDPCIRLVCRTRPRLTWDTVCPSRSSRRRAKRRRYRRVVTTDRDVELDAVLIGGREPVSITFVDYDPDWALRFGSLRDRIRAAVGPVAIDVEHIGSTAVPGLAAKPIIDILLTVRDVDDEATYVPPMVRAGFVLRVREPGHRMFRTPERGVHVHVYEPRHQAVRDYLDLRDWLRLDGRDRTRYAEAKRALAARSWSDMNYYADAKSEVITLVLGRARRWRESTLGSST
jgi:GrpB-like predicted nucleotidyltransferase (UPF0157 family)